MALENRQVHLQVMQGPLQGRVYVVMAGTSLTIGRLPDCGITNPEDLTLSRLHAVVELHADDCWLVNRSSNGTFVNEESVERIRLQDGDVIKCAQLVLKYLGTQEPEKVKSSIWERPTRFEGQHGQECHFHEMFLPVGWSWLTPKPMELPREIVLSQLAAFASTATLIIDWRRARMEPPPDTPEGRPLFHWLPPESAQLASPMVLRWEWAQWSQTIVDQACGKDALLWLFSESAPDAALAALRQATGFGTSSGLLGYCWPSILTELLKHQSGEMIQRVLSAGPAWMVDQAEGWNLAVDPAFRERLVHIPWHLENDSATIQAL